MEVFSFLLGAEASEVPAEASGTSVIRGSFTAMVSDGPQGHRGLTTKKQHDQWPKHQHWPHQPVIAPIGEEYL